METHRIAAVDIGSNSIKLVLVEVAANSHFNILLQERERVRLGQETLNKKILSAEAIGRSAKAISRFTSIAESQEAEKIIAVATASVREAENAADFVREIKEKTGVPIEILSSIEEARLIGVAAVQYFGLKEEALLNIDIGGGSTELSLMRGCAAEKLFSMPLGAINLTEKFLFANPPDEMELKNLRKEIALALEKPIRELKKEKWQMASGTSGTILNLAMLLNFQTYGKCEISFERFIGLNKMLVRLGAEERAKLPCISTQRAEVIIAGGQILEIVMRELKIQAVEPCAFALREGVIIDYLHKIKTGLLCRP